MCGRLTSFCGQNHHVRTGLPDRLSASRANNLCDGFVELVRRLHGIKITNAAHVKGLSQPDAMAGIVKLAAVGTENVQIVLRHLRGSRC